jgi:hypothetical protein
MKIDNRLRPIRTPTAAARAKTMMLSVVLSRAPADADQAGKAGLRG